MTTDPLTDLFRNVLSEALAINPPRGTYEYAAGLDSLTSCTDVARLMQDTRAVYLVYGWRGIADLLEMATDQISFFGAHLRDGFGRIPLDQLVNLSPDEEDLLSAIVDIVNNPEINLERHSFSSARAYAEYLLRINRDWVTTVQRALDASADRWDQVWPLVAQTPGLRSPDTPLTDIVHGVLVVMLAGQAVRDVDLHAPYLVQGAPVTGHPLRALKDARRIPPPLGGAASPHLP